MVRRRSRRSLEGDVLHTRTELRGHALRASRFPAGEDVHSPNPFLARRFGPHGTAWARQIPLLRSGLFELGPRHVYRGRDTASAPVVPLGEDRSEAAVPFQFRWVAMRVFSLSGSTPSRKQTSPLRLHSRAWLPRGLNSLPGAVSTGRTVQLLTSSDHAHTTVVSIRSASDRLEAPRVDALVDCSDRRVCGCLDSFDASLACVSARADNNFAFGATRQCG